MLNKTFVNFFIAAALTLCVKTVLVAVSVNVENNYDFNLTVPVKTEVNASKYGFSVHLPPKSKQTIGLDAKDNIQQKKLMLQLENNQECVIIYNNKPVTKILWDLVVIPTDTYRVITSSSPGQDKVIETFSPLNLKLKETVSNNGYQRTVYESTKNGYYINIVFDIFDDMWFDVEAIVTNKAAQQTAVYVALVKKMTFTDYTESKVSWNNLQYNLNETLFFPRRTDMCRQVLHGVDWLLIKMSNNLNFTLLNDFTAGRIELFNNAVYQNTAMGVNSRIVYQNTFVRNKTVYTTSEISEWGTGDSFIKFRYRSLSPNETMSLHYRFGVFEQQLNPLLVNAQFIAYTGYKKTFFDTNSGYPTFIFGVPAVEFGTNIGPYHKCIENFDIVRNIGLKGEKFWPRMAEFWPQWQKMKYEIITDLCIIRSLGMSIVRIGLGPGIYQNPEYNKYVLDFYDFLADECRKFGLKIMFIETLNNPELAAERICRYSDVVKYVEEDNEILMHGVQLKRVDRWKKTCDLIRQKSPEIQIFFTGATNQGTFEYLKNLGIKFDAAGLHFYTHNLEDIPSVRNMALAVANIAGKHNVPPIIGELNWKRLTRMTPETRRGYYAQVFGNFLSVQAVPTVVQYHFAETMSVNPRLGRQGIRHYELVWYDRSPKIELAELQKLIKQYSAPDSPIREFEFNLPFSTTTSYNNFITLNGSIKNLTTKKVVLDTEIISPPNIHITGFENRIVLQPGETKPLNYSINIESTTKSGYYHYFLKTKYEITKIAVGWGIISLPGIPEFDLNEKPLAKINYIKGRECFNKFDFTKPLAIVYGQDCPVLEMELGYVLFNTLHSVLGREIKLYHLPDLPENVKQEYNLIVIGSTKTNSLINEFYKTLPNITTPWVDFLEHNIGQKTEHQVLILSGSDEIRAEISVIDFVFRYWKNAKDSALARFGYTFTPIKGTQTENTDDKDIDD